MFGRHFESTIESCLVAMFEMLINRMVLKNPTRNVIYDGDKSTDQKTDMTTHYPLSNPLIRFLDKMPESWTRMDMIRIIEEKPIEKLVFHYTGLDGKLKELRLPLFDRYRAEKILTDGERVDGSSIFKGLVDTGLSDLYVVPDYSTAFLNPFESGSLDFICRYLTPDGQLAPFAPDTILLKADRHLKETCGVQLKAFGELEFYLLFRDDDPLYHASKQKGYHAASPFIKGGQLLDEMMRALAQMTGSVKYAHSEVGYVEHVYSATPEINGRHAEQMEIEFLPMPVLPAADAVVLAKWLIRNIAYRHQAVATFAPKIEEGIAGNGMHIHIELQRDEKNAMLDRAGQLSTDARRVIGGLCTFADSLTAFGNTAASSYLRLVPDQEAPTRVCWSDMNRSAMIRVPLGWTKATHLARVINPQTEETGAVPCGMQTVELRTADGSALVHAFLAGIVMATEWGLTHDESLKTAETLYVQGNIFKNPAVFDKLPRIPSNCVESSRILNEKRGLYQRDGLFPPSVIEYFIHLLRAENDEILQKTLSELPPDDRLNETRKIMHKDLHRH